MPACKHASPREGCYVCRLAARKAADPKGAPAARAPLRMRERLAGACVHLGEATGGVASCRRCGGDKSAPTRACAERGACTVETSIDGTPWCGACDRFETALDRPPEFTRVARFDHHNLAVGMPGLRFNSSIIDHEGGYLLAYRDGWKGSNINMVRLDADFRQQGPAWRLDLTRAESLYGREDPRLFRFRGKIHVSYVGVVVTRKKGRRGRRREDTHTNVLYARLGENLQVEANFAPRYASRRPWEKSWNCFEHDGELYAVYTCTPHRILRLRGEEAELVYETDVGVPWRGGELRGGAAPVRVGDEWWHFCHDSIGGRDGKVYRVGLYAFSAAPPFAMTRMIPEPLMVADKATNPGNYASVAWVAGAVRRGDEWALAISMHDRWQEIHTARHAELEARLAPLPEPPLSPPPWWAQRTWWADPGIWRHVVELDEYRLDRLDLAGRVVLDVGAHVGCFAYKAKARGAAAVHCYEPYPESALLLRGNAARMPGVKVFAAAVAGEAGRGRMERPSERNSGDGNVVREDGGPVEIVPLDEAILRAAADSPDGRVALLKLDCELCERSALRSVTRLDLVDRVALEWHPPCGAAEVSAALERNGFLVETVDGEDGRGLAFARRPSPCAGTERR